MVPDGCHDAVDGGDHLAPALVVRGELVFAEPADGVELGALIAVALLPLGLDPALAFKAMESGIKRAGLDLEDLIGGRADGLADAVAVLLAPLEGLEDEHVEGSLEELDAVLIGAFCHGSLS